MAMKLGMDLGGAIGGIGGGIIGAIAGNYQSNKQWEREKEAMGLQYGYNEKMAQSNQERNKDMWNYTNYENQKAHMQNAGLNPALIYGMSGGGGSSTSGGQGSGVSQSGTQSGMVGMKAQEMGLQLASIASQIKVNDSQANKNNAEAEKVAGVDTEAQKATINNIIEQTTNEKAKNGLIYADQRLKDAESELRNAETGYTTGKTEEVQWSIKQISRDIDKLGSVINGLDLDNELKEKTMKNRIKESQMVLDEIAANVFEKSTRGQLNKEQAKQTVEDIKQKWQQIGINLVGKELDKQELELQAEKIMNELNIGKLNIEQKDRVLVKDYILGIGEIAVKGMSAFMGKGATAIKGFGR